jgi:type I restriction enzyme S subunit
MAVERVHVEELIRGEVLEVGDGYRAKNSELASAGLPFARAGNINQGFRFADADRFPVADLARVGRKVSRPGDVVFTSKGSVGRFALVSKDVETFVYSPQLCYWRSLDAAMIDPRWLYYWMSSSDFRSQFEAVSRQTDMAEYVSLRDQRAMELPVVPIDEQRRIAHILGTLDDKIELNRRMSATLEEMARALFKSWFVDFDPVRAKAGGRETGLPPYIASLFPDRLIDSELGAIPEGWTWKRLPDLADFLNGLALQKYPSVPGIPSLPVIKIAQLRALSTDGADRASLLVPQDYLVRDGDLLFSWSGSLLVDYWTGEVGALNQHLFKVTPVGQRTLTFVRQALFVHLERFRDIAAHKATTMGHIKRGDLDESWVATPPEDILVLLSTLLNDLDGRLLSARSASRTAAELRDVLLRELVA